MTLNRRWRFDGREVSKPGDVGSLPRFDATTYGGHDQVGLAWQLRTVPATLNRSKSLCRRTSRVAPSPLRITVRASCYAVTQEASHAGDPGGAPVEELFAPPPL